MGEGERRERETRSSTPPVTGVGGDGCLIRKQSYRDGQKGHMWKLVATSGALLCPWRQAACTHGSSSVGLIPLREISGPKDGCVFRFRWILLHCIPFYSDIFGR